MNGFLKMGHDSPFVLSAHNASNLPVLSGLASEYAIFDRWFAQPTPTNPNVSPGGSALCLLTRAGGGGSARSCAAHPCGAEAALALALHPHPPLLLRCTPPPTSFAAGVPHERHLARGD